MAPGARGRAQRAQLCDQRLKRRASVADQRDLGGADLPDLGRVDVEVNDPRAGREAVDPPGDAVVEARPDGEQQVALVDRPVGRAHPVHAEHPQPAAIRRGERTECHQRRHDRRVGEPRELGQYGRRAGMDDAATGVDHRALRLGERERCRANRRGIGERGGRARAADALDASPGATGARATSVGTSTSTGPGRPLHATVNASWIAGATSRGRSHAIACLTIGARHADHVGLLERVRAAQVRAAPGAVIATSGTESICASASGVTRFVAPGPE